MKKEYFTPEIIFDSFALSQNVASINSNCDRNLTNEYSGNCGMPFGNRVLFTVTATGCTYKVQDGSSQANGMCYHLPMEGRRLFNS